MTWPHLTFASWNLACGSLSSCVYLEKFYLPVLINMYTMFIQYSECTSCAVRLKCMPPKGPKVCRETI